MRYYELLEGLTIGEFTFGFELEAFYDTIHPGVFDSDIESSVEFIEDTVLPIIESNGVFGKIVNDGSIEANKNTQIPFEFVSDPINFNSSNLQKLFKTLNSLKSNNIRTNSSCGFHFHVKYPNLSTDDMRWILACISTNSQYQDVTMNFKDYDFYNLEYASPEVYQELENAIESNDNSEIVGLLDHSKYQVLRIHPQGTLEWRGPRNFLNAGNSEEIHDFIIHLYGYIRMIIRCLDQKSVGGYTKREFYDLFKGVGKVKLNDDQINFIKNYSGKEKEIAKDLVVYYPLILKVKFKSPPKIYFDNNNYYVEGDVINGYWNLPLNVIYQKGTFSTAIFKNGYFNGNWDPSSVWLNGVTGKDYTYDGEKVINDVTPKKWEEFLSRLKT